MRRAVDAVDTRQVSRRDLRNPVRRAGELTELGGPSAIRQWSRCSTRRATGLEPGKMARGRRRARDAHASTTTGDACPPLRARVLACRDPDAVRAAARPRNRPRRRRPSPPPSRRTSSARSARQSPRATSPAAKQLLNAYRASKGTTPEALEALSWLGRGALAAKQLDKAENYALETYDLCLEALKTRPMDAEPRLPIAIGAAIEVRAHVHAAARRPRRRYLPAAERAGHLSRRLRSAPASRRTSTCCRSRASPRRRSSRRSTSGAVAPVRRRRAEGQAGRAVLLGALVSRTARRWPACSRP